MVDKPITSEFTRKSWRDTDEFARELQRMFNHGISMAMIDTVSLNTYYVTQDQFTELVTIIDGIGGLEEQAGDSSFVVFGGDVSIGNHLFVGGHVHGTFVGTANRALEADVAAEATHAEYADGAASASVADVAILANAAGTLRTTPICVGFEADGTPIMSTISYFGP